MVRRPQFICCWLFLLVTITFGLYTALTWYLADPFRRTSGSVDISFDEQVDFRAGIARQLLDVVLELKRQAKNVKPELLMKLNKIINQIDPHYAFSTEDSALFMSEENADVCGEIYNGTLYGYPFYKTGFVEDPECKKDKKPPLEKLVTIILLDKTGNLEELKYIIHQIRNYNNKIPIVFGSVAPRVDIVAFKSNYSDVHGFDIDMEDVRRPGKVMNLMVDSVKTPYILFAKDIFHFNPLARVERQIYAISSNKLVGISGGAFRNETGYWKVGCYLTEMKNYILKYTEGYKYSALDCMICDHLEGPFVARASIFKIVKFNDHLSKDVVFEDLFLKIKQQNILVVACPDVMYFKKGYVEGLSEEEKSQEHESWLQLAKEWQVDHIIYPSKVSLEFSCKELQITCDATRYYKAFFLPSCCIKQVFNALKCLHEFSIEKGVGYEIEAGTLLGAVKLRSFMPWDRDGDITFLGKDIDTFYENSAFFKKRGFSLSNFKHDKSGYFRLNTPNIMLEMWGDKRLSTSELPSEMWEIPTMVKILGLWIKAEWNPGLFARNRYGPNYLKHVQHWGAMKFADSWQTYKPGSWLACPKKAHHACMDHYPTDGSIGLLPESLQ